MKKCTTCKDNKNLTEFNKNKRKKDGYSNVCRDCNKKYSQKYYNNNKDIQLESVRKRAKVIITENRKKYFQLLSEGKCKKCPEADVFALEYDHRDGEVKVASIRTMVGAGYCWKTIESEIAKCDLLCANCHRKRTGIAQGWYKDLLETKMTNTTHNHNTNTTHTMRVAAPMRT